MKLFGSFRRWLTEDLFVSHAYLNTRIDHVARTVGDVWINYPWEAINIEEHDQNAEAGRK